MDLSPRRVASLAFDVTAVVVFVVIGRATHQKGDALAGIASTSWPFLAGVAAGWLLVRAWRRPAAIVPTGVVTWLVCVAFGMTLRVIAGQGTAVAFIGVALGFLGATMLGWRLVALVVSRERS